MAFRALAAVLLTVAPALAQAPPAPYAPFVGEHTSLLVRFDPRAIDVGATFDALGRHFDRIAEQASLHPDERRQARERLDAARRVVLERVQAWRQAGGREVYLLGDLETLEPLLVVPLGEGARPEALEALVRELPVPKDWRSAQAHGALLMGTEKGLREAEALVPAERADLTDALQVMGEAPLAAVLVPSEALREAQQGPPDRLRVIEPLLEAAYAQAFGWGPLLAGGVVRLVEAGAAVTVAPEFGVRIVYVSDRHMVQAMPLMVDGAFDSLMDAGQRWGIVREAQREALDELLRTQVEGSQVILALSQERLLAIAAMVVPGIVSADRRHLGWSEENLRTLNRGIGWYLAAADEPSAGPGMAGWPPPIDGWLPSMKALVPMFRSRPDARGPYDWRDVPNPFDSPRYESVDPIDYVYIRPSAPLDELPAPERTVLMYEKFDTWPALGIPVLFADYHIEVIESRERFDELLTGKDGRDD